MKALIHAALYDFHTFHKDAYVLFDEIIHEVGPMGAFPGAEEIYDCSGCVVLPGFVLGHGHIYSTFSRGWSTPFSPQTFTELLEQMWWKLDRSLNRESIYYSGLVSGVEFIKNGITTVIDHHASGAQIKGTLKELEKSICDRMGLRGIFCFETSDRFPLEKCIEENIRFAGETRDKKSAGLFGLHASMTLSDESLKKIAEASKGLPIHIHVAESLEDVEDCKEKYKKSIIDRLESFDLLRPDSLLAHCTHITDQEVKQLSQREVVIALNPTSNMNNGVGLPDYKDMRENKISAILGNDGLGFDLTRDMENFVYAMHHKYENPIDISIEDLKNLIKDAYAYAGKLLKCNLGRIEKGYEADLQVIPYIPPTICEEENIFGHFFYGMISSFHPRDVWCGGERRLANYEVQEDVVTIYEEARKISKKLWDTIKGGKS